MSRIYFTNYGVGMMLGNDRRVPSPSASMRRVMPSRTPMLLLLLLVAEVLPGRMRCSQASDACSCRLMPADSEAVPRPAAAAAAAAAAGVDAASGASGAAAPAELGVRPDAGAAGSTR
jgi:hypothetical protein